MRSAAVPGRTRHADRVARADFVIHTDGSLEDTNRQVDDVLRELRQAN